MRLLFVADGRSPIALNWMTHFVESGHEVHLLSTFPCKPDLKLASLTVVSVAFSALAGRGRGTSGRAIGGARGIHYRFIVRHWLGPLTIPWAVERARKVIRAVKPDLVHAMRIPFEGILAAAAYPPAPLLISVWGNDFTLHARATSFMGLLTRRALGNANALHVDCKRDLELAHEWGYSQRRPALILPGAGGVRPEVFHSGETDRIALSDPVGEMLQGIPPDAPVVVNPRGFRAYVRNDTFFLAIPFVLEEHPEAIFLCPAMAGESQAQSWVDQLGIHASVRLLPWLSPVEMAAIYQRAQVTVSPTEHDGTPNTLLEGMACGCLPVAGDLESIREWIEDGANGLLIDPSDPQALANAVNRGLRDRNLRHQARVHNLRLIAARATYSDVMMKAESFYKQIAVQSFERE